MATRHFLAPPRGLPPEPASVMRVMERLGSLQFDPLEVTGRNHDLVLAARIDGYQRVWTDDLLYASRTLYETYNKGLSMVPTKELPLYRIAWDLSHADHTGAAFDEHAPLVEELLDRIRTDGPLSSTDFSPRAAIDWYWRPTNQVRAILEALAEAGILGLARREGNRRIYDLAERLFPADLLAQRLPERDQRRHKLLSRYRAHGLLGRMGSAEIWTGVVNTTREAKRPDEPTRAELLAELVESGMLVPVTIEGVRGERFILAEETAILEAAAAARVAGPDHQGGAGSPGVAFLAPLDPFVWDRDFLRSLYDFDYVWEVYVPAPSGARGPSTSSMSGGRTASIRWRPWDSFPLLSRHLRRWRASGTSNGSSSRGHFVIGCSFGRSSIAWAIGAGSGVDPDDLPGAPVPGPVAGSDTDLAVVGTSPRHGLAGRGRRAPRDPRAADDPALDLEVAEARGEHLEAHVGAPPADRDADAVATERRLAGRAEACRGAGLIAFLDEDAGIVHLAGGRLRGTVADVVVAGRDHDLHVAG